MPARSRMSRFTQMYGAADAPFVKSMPDALRSTFQDLQLAPDSLALRQGYIASAFIQTTR